MKALIKRVWLCSLFYSTPTSQINTTNAFQARKLIQLLSTKNSKLPLLTCATAAEYIFAMVNGPGHNEVEEEEEPPMRRVYHLAVFDKSADRIVAQKLADSIFQLPVVQIPADLYWEGDEVVEKSIEPLLGVSVYFSDAMCEEFNYVHDRRGVDCLRWLVYVDTCGEVPDVEEPFEWVSCEEACTGTWIMKDWIEEGDDVREEIERVFGELKRVQIADDDRAWMTAGWCGRVTAWARKVLRERDLSMTGKFRLHVEAEKSTIMKSMISQLDDAHCQEIKSEAVGGDDKRRKLNDDEDGRVDVRENESDFVFVKGYERAVREGERTAAVGKVVGKIIPEVLGVNEREGAMLQRDAGALTGDCFDEDVLMETIFTMQKRSLDRVEELEGDGVVVADSRWVGTNVEKILGHELLDDWSEESLKNGNKEAKRRLEKLRSCAPKFKKMCRKLSDYDLPNVIVHGDLALRNVGSRSKGEGGLYQFFDWEMCFIGNPLHDFASILGAQYPEIPGCTMNCRAGRKEVCKRWLPSVSEEEMRKLFEIIEWIDGLIKIHLLSQQYSTYDCSNIGARMVVIDVADSLLDTDNVPKDEL